ncbi:MAG: arsenate reductase (glutaredoxin) [Alphaproteobacteria bacterium HGW-Alphaproteobacteria-2]|nr:MAG: arsenate reductase (glutaredoxin) [Alphaproteobacteria bacterium HGW-Alphaproteobacteria-2]
MDRLTLWHNPRCSKSRAALAALEARGAVPQVRRYIDDPPDTAEIARVLALLALPAHALIRRCEPEYAALGLSEAAPEAALVAAMAAHPRLIERPVAIGAGRAVIGRPPERVLELLEG